MKAVINNVMMRNCTIVFLLGFMTVDLVGAQQSAHRRSPSISSQHELEVFDPMPRNSSFSRNLDLAGLTGGQHSPGHGRKLSVSFQPGEGFVSPYGEDLHGQLNQVENHTLQEVVLAIHSQPVPADSGHSSSSSSDDLPEVKFHRFPRLYEGGQRLHQLSVDSLEWLMNNKKQALWTMVITAVMTVAAVKMTDSCGYALEGCKQIEVGAQQLARIAMASCSDIQFGCDMVRDVCATQVGLLANNTQFLRVELQRCTDMVSYYIGLQKSPDAGEPTSNPPFPIPTPKFPKPELPQFPVAP